MKLRTVGRDWQLSLRMAVVMALLVLVYIVIVGVIVWLFKDVRHGPLYIAVVSLAIVATLIWQVFYAHRLLVGAMRPAQHAKTADLKKRLERLCALEELPTPRLEVVESDDANAFTFGISPGRAVVVLTTGLCDLLAPDELDAVLAHEVGHIASRDAIVMTIAGAPRLLGDEILGRVANAGDADPAFFLWFLLWPILIVPIVVGTLLTLTLSRYREFVADRASALLTGRPASLMSSLTKLSETIPTGDLRTASPLCIVNPFHKTGIFRDHPPLEPRLAALAEIARELGEPAPRGQAHPVPRQQ